MKYCTNCGTQLSDDAKFCSVCGTRQEAAKAVVHTSIKNFVEISQHAAIIVAKTPGGVQGFNIQY